jgi:hypothetical protein
MFGSRVSLYFTWIDYHSLSLSPLSSMHFRLECLSFFIFPMWHFSSCEYFSTLDYSGYQSILCHAHYFIPQKGRLHRESFHSLKSTHVALHTDLEDASMVYPLRTISTTNQQPINKINIEMGMARWQSDIADG